MALTQKQAVDIAVADLAKRRGVKTGDVAVVRQEDAQFSNGALGAAVDGEMAAMMMTSGWRITLKSAGDSTEAEYRANPQQIRLYRYQGANYKIHP